MAEKKSTKPSDKKPTSKEAEKPEVKKVEKPEEAKKETKTKDEKRKSNKGLFWGIVGGILAIILILCLFLLRGGPAPDDPKAKLNYSNSFFIYDNGKYTLWNSAGKRVTQEEYDYASGILANYACVKKDDKYAIMRDDGTITVPFGKYGDIEARGGLFLTRDGNTKEYSVLTGAGKEIMKGQNLSITSPNSYSAFAVIETETDYTVVTYSGQRIGVFQKEEDVDEPTTNMSSDFGAFYYNGQNVIFDTRTGKTLAAFEGDCYSFDSITEDRRKILLEDQSDEKNHILIANNKIYNLNETKYYIFVTPDELVGYNGDDDNGVRKISLLDADYRVTKEVGNYTALKDINNYATKNEDGNVEIVYKGNVVKTFEDNADLESGVLYDDFYAIKNNDKIMFYHLDGSVAFKHEYDNVWSLFNKNHQAIVSDKDDEYYLIDSKGNRVGEATFKRATYTKGGYETKNEDDKYAIMNLKGELITDFKYESLYYREVATDHNIWTARNNYNDYDVIDVTSKKVLLQNVNVNSFNTNYFTIKNADGKYEYYTYSGELFYTSEK